MKERWGYVTNLCNFGTENRLLEMYVNDGMLSL